MKFLILFISLVCAEECSRLLSELKYQSTNAPISGGDILYFQSFLPLVCKDNHNTRFFITYPLDFYTYNTGEENNFYNIQVFTQPLMQMVGETYALQYSNLTSAYYNGREYTYSIMVDLVGKAIESSGVAFNQTYGVFPNSQVKVAGQISIEDCWATCWVSS